MGYACAALLLPGHGGTAKDFAHSSQQQWTEQVHKEVHRYAELYPNVYLMGHSMGGLFAINESICSKANVKGLILLNTAIKMGLKAAALCIPQRIFSAEIQFIIALTAITEKITA